MTCCSVAMLLATACPGRAQEPLDASGHQATELARERFHAGVAAARESRWEAAYEAFARALALDDRPITRMNLAGAEARTGRLLAAIRDYRTFLTAADSEVLATYRDDVQRVLARLEPRVAHIALPPLSLGPGEELRLDDSVVPHADQPLSLPVDPGLHRIAVLRDGVAVADVVVRASEGESVHVVLSVPDRADPTAPVSGPAPVADLGAPRQSEAGRRPTPRPHDRPPTDQSAGIPPAALVSLIVAGASAVSFAVFGGLALAKDAELADTCSPRCSEQERGELRTLSIAADASLGLALVGAGLGITLWLIDDGDAHRPSDRAAMLPRVGRQGAAASWQFRF